MTRSLVAVLLAVALVAPAAVSPAADAADALIEDSLTALDGLVAADNCALRDAADGDTDNGVTLPYVHCDDGFTPRGGGSSGIPVPVKYRARPNGDDWSGLPPPASVEEVAAADATEDLKPERDNRITLDVNVTLPPSPNVMRNLGLDIPTIKPPKGGYPVIVFMHGCCGGNKTSWEAATVDAEREHWHHSNAWFASRGYVVITYTARGFRDSQDRGSTGSTQLDSRRYEINDYQYLVGLLADHDARRRAQGERPTFRINPGKIGAVGGSYGGGFSWLATTDPTWRSPAERIAIKLAAAVPKYGWTDLIESLLPSGHYFDRNPDTGRTALAPTNVPDAPSRHPLGVVKQSIVAGLYATGNLVAGNHTTFPDYIHEAFARIQQGEPYDGDPLLERVMDSFLSDRSAYFQQRFWNRVRNGLRVPLYVPATWTDPLFPPMESIRFYNKLKSIDPQYPVQMYLGDYQHFVANKAKEWGDLCADDHHVCTFEDHVRAGGSFNLNRAPKRVRTGINSRINRFLDHFLMGKGARPKMNVSATTTICPANAGEGYPGDEPGIEYRAPTWRALGSGRTTFEWTDGGAASTMTSSLAMDGHAPDSDPVVRDRQSDKCFTPQQPSAGPGVVRHVSDPIARPFTMMGIPTVRTVYATTASNYWIAARLFDLPPDGAATMVTRGVCKVNAAAAPDVTCEAFDLFGNGWTFEAGNRVVLELTQADVPFLRRSNFPSTISFSEASVEIPTVPPSRKSDFRG